MHNEIIFIIIIISSDHLIKLQIPEGRQCTRPKENTKRNRAQTALLQTRTRRRARGALIITDAPSPEKGRQPQVGSFDSCITSPALVAATAVAVVVVVAVPALPRPPRVPRLLVLPLALPLPPGGRRPPLEMLLLLARLLLVVVVRRRGSPPLLLRRQDRLLVVVTAVALLSSCGGSDASLGRRRGCRALVGGRPAGGVGFAGEADAGEDASLGLGPLVCCSSRRLRVLCLVPRRRWRRRREGQVVVAVGRGALLAGAGGAVRGATRVPVRAVWRRRQCALRPVRLGPRPLHTRKRKKTGPQVRTMLIPPFSPRLGLDS